ncbi:MAG: hypothetical protein P8Z38_09185 [Robiginitalea sp.]
MSRKLKQGLVFLGAFMFLFMVRAQDRRNQEQIKSLKIAFFTERLNLTPEEATVFWPIYNDHEKEKEGLRDQQRQELRDRFSNLDEISEQEAQKALKRYLDLEEQEEELDKEFYERIAREFSAVRTLKLFQAEWDFRRRLLQEYRKRRDNRP